MTCPFCKQPIPPNVAPFDHMVPCQKAEAERWDQRFRHAAAEGRRLETANGYE